MADLTAVLGHPIVAGVARSRVAQWLVHPHRRVSRAALCAAVAGSTVLVTGASYGVGEATARRLGAAGAHVLLVARTESALADTARRITGAGGTATAYPADLSDPAQVDELAARLLAEHESIDVIVSNAGRSIRRSLADSYDRFHDFTRTTDINYLGPVKLLLALLPAMRARGAGHLVNVSTVAVLMPPSPRWVAYQASKAAFDVFFRGAAAEIAADGVTATSLYLSLVRTRMSAPTPIFAKLPGMSPGEAADLVCRAIVERPARISPWWAYAAEAAGLGLGGRPWEVLARRFAHR